MLRERNPATAHVYFRVPPDVREDHNKIKNLIDAQGIKLWRWYSDVLKREIVRLEKQQKGTG